MVLQEAAGVPRINARESDVFDIFNLKHYLGPNPYLNTAAFTFDFALTQCPQPLPIDVYLSKVCFHFPQLQEGSYPSYAHLFARLVTEVNRLQMDLHLQKWSCHPFSEYVRIAVQTLHGRTTRAAVILLGIGWKPSPKGSPSILKGRCAACSNCFATQCTVGQRSMPSCGLLTNAGSRPTTYGMKG
jgi:hypothetical protein